MTNVAGNVQTRPQHSGGPYGKKGTRRAAGIFPGESDIALRILPVTIAAFFHDSRHRFTGDLP